MNKLRRSLALVLALLVLTSSAAVLAETEKPVIGILQYVEHVALDAARDGFVDALSENGYKDGENITLDVRNAQASPDILSSIADHFVSVDAKLVLAIATPAAQTMAAKSETIPILATAITDFVVARLAKSNEEPGYNITGTTDMNPIKEQIELLKRLVPEAKTVGVLYTASEDNSVLQAQVAKEVIESLGMQYEEVTVHNANDVQQATTSIVEQCDAIYIPTDNIFASAMPVVYEVAVANKKPVIAGESGMVMAGGLATLGIDYYNLGHQTGLMAIEVLGGADVSTMPIQSQKEFSYTINKTMADAIGLTIPEDLAPFAKEMAN